MPDDTLATAQLITACRAGDAAWDALAVARYKWSIWNCVDSKPTARWSRPARLRSWVGIGHSRMSTGDSRPTPTRPAWLACVYTFRPHQALIVLELLAQVGRPEHLHTATLPSTTSLV